MKNVGIIILLLLTFANFLQGQTLEKREKIMVVKNHIKSQIQWDYKYTNGSVAKNGTKVSVTTFNQAGDILKKDNLNPKGIVVASEKYQYDAHGNRTYYERNTTNGKYDKRSQYDVQNNLLLEAGFDGVENFKNSYSYNSNDKLQEIIFRVNDNIQEKHVYHYSGNTAIVDIYGGGTSLTSKLKLVYDPKGNIIQQTVYNVDNKVIENTIRKYDAHSRILEEEKTRGGKLDYRTTYNYDPKGNLLTVSEESPFEKKFVKKSFTYDAKGNLTEYKWHRSASDPFNVKHFTYDSKGICITEHTLYPKTKYELLSKYQYTYY